MHADKDRIKLFQWDRFLIRGTLAPAVVSMETASAGSLLSHYKPS